MEAGRFCGTGRLFVCRSVSYFWILTTPLKIRITGKSPVYTYHQTVNSLLRVIFIANARARSVFRDEKVQIPAHVKLQCFIKFIYLDEVEWSVLKSSFKKDFKFEFTQEELFFIRSYRARAIKLYLTLVMQH